MSKDFMKILEGLINFIEDMISRKINFLKSIWVFIERNWSLGIEIGLQKV
jgi:hypothetical protein